MRNGARLKPPRNVSPSMSKSQGGPGFGALSKVRRSGFASFKFFSLYISTTVNFRMAYGSSAQKVSAENPPVAPLQQRDRRYYQVPTTLACADHQGLNRAAISPQVIDHKTIRICARVHPFDLRPFVQQTYVLQFQKHAGRVARVLLIECDLECERPNPGEKVELVGYRTTVKT